jgi:hypothetical protein
MALSRAAVFSAKVAGLLTAAGIAIAVPIVGATSSSADPKEPPAPPATPTATTNGHDWIG